MDLTYSSEEQAFRDEVRTFIEKNLPAHIRSRGGPKPLYSTDDVAEWHRILARKGWVASHWPREYGGPGWSAIQRYIFLEELLSFPTPEPLSFNINMIGPVIYTFGNQAQKDYWLPRIRNLDTWFCQGFSEPNAGSDLASLRTRAQRDGDEYIVNGQKMWTTTAHVADWIFALVRTDAKAAKKQLGISLLLIDLKSPGVEVRPISTIDGHHHTNEVFFDNVRVPAANLVGEENRGWDCAKFLLGNERIGIARVGLSRNRLARAKALAQEQILPDGSPLSACAEFRKKATKMEVDLKALEITALRLIDAVRTRTDGKPDPRTSIVKLCGSDLQQATAEFMLDAAGPLAAGADSLAGADGVNGNSEIPGFAVASTYFNTRPATIYGGSSEVQKNIIAKAILGL